jgi:hypothetical protein
MTTELKNQKQEVSKEQWQAGIGWNKPLEYADLVKAAVEYTDSKEEEENKKLPVTCINDFVDILSLYVTSGELTPGEFMRCFQLAVEAELKVQQKITDSLTDILDSL